MKLLLPLLQILMLALGFASNRADAMAGAAVFAVLCVVGVLLGQHRASNQSPAGKRSAARR